MVLCGPLHQGRHDLVTFQTVSTQHRLPDMLQIDLKPSHAQTVTNVFSQDKENSWLLHQLIGSFARTKHADGKYANLHCADHDGLNAHR